MELDEVVRGLATAGQLVHLEVLPARPARTGALAEPLPPAVAAAVPAGGLWSHQAAAVDLARCGRSVALATGTASGKSLCYQLPIAEAVVAGGTGLALFPTKALAQDQLRGLAALGVAGVVPAAYDGDAAPEARAWARRHANVVLTNPDMLHAGILPNHGRWAHFLGRLRYVVLDELHGYRGIFGTHVAQLVRRLRRLCAHYGAAPTFLFTSATIGAPAALAAAILGEPVAEVVDDGSPRGERLFALWNPPLVDETAGTRGSPTVETAAVLAAAVAGGYRAIAFTRSRRGAELVAAGARRALPAELAERVRPYRGGYLATERREIEHQLFGGDLLGVSATNALELGVDVGGLDACVLNGFPGTIASMWQQAGRAGRARQRSLAVLVAGHDALDQWLMAHPDQVFTRAPEPAVVNPANPFVLDPHLACAAYELALVPDDERFWGPPWLPAGAFEEAVGRLVRHDRLTVRAGRVVHAGPGRPAGAVGLRNGSLREVAILLGDAVIGTVDASRAPTTVHPGALYLHQGLQYRVVALDLDGDAAHVEPCDADELTQVRSETQVAILATEGRLGVGRSCLHLGAVEITEQVTGYRRTDARSGEVLADVDLDLPPTVLTTRAFWYTIDEQVLADAGILARQVPGALHAIEHAGIGMLPLFTICDRWDVGGVSTAWLADTRRPTIVVYDGYPGGAGIAELGFAAGRRHLAATLEVISACGCEAGCPSCVQSPKCGNLNDPLDKAAAVAVLDVVLG